MVLGAGFCTMALLCFQSFDKYMHKWRQIYFQIKTKCILKYQMETNTFDNFNPPISQFQMKKNTFENLENAFQNIKWRPILLKIQTF